MTFLSRNERTALESDVKQSQITATHGPEAAPSSLSEVAS